MPGEAGDALTDVSGTVGGVVGAAETGNYGDMGALIMETTGTATAAAGYDEIGTELTDWGAVAGTGVQAGLDNGDALQAVTATLGNAADTATKYQDPAATGVPAAGTGVPVTGAVATTQVPATGAAVTGVPATGAAVTGVPATGAALTGVPAGAAATGAAAGVPAAGVPATGVAAVAPAGTTTVASVPATTTPSVIQSTVTINGVNYIQCSDAAGNVVNC